MTEPFASRRPAPAAVILAGGRGERLGGATKAALVVGGQRLLDRVASVLGDCAPVLVAHGPLDPAMLQLSSRQIGLPDIASDYAGPLAGLAAAVAWLHDSGDRAELLVSAAVDTPFLPHDYVSRLATGLGGAPAGIAFYAGQPYPTNSIWRLAAIADLPERVRSGTAPRSLKRLALELHATGIDWSEQPGGDPFANINTPEDLAVLALRADRQTPR